MPLDVQQTLKSKTHAIICGLQQLRVAPLYCVVSCLSHLVIDVKQRNLHTGNHFGVCAAASAAQVRETNWRDHPIISRGLCAPYSLKTNASVFPTKQEKRGRHTVCVLVQHLVQFPVRSSSRTISSKATSSTANISGLLLQVDKTKQVRLSIRCLLCGCWSIQLQYA